MSTEISTSNPPISEKTISTQRTCNDSMESHQSSDRLRKVAGYIPIAVWLISVTSLLERFAYHSFLGPWQNYIQNSTTDPLHPGALGLGQSTASILVNVFLLLSFLTPIAAGIVSDNYLGRFRTISFSLCTYILGVLILLVTSIPSLVARGSGLPGLIVAMGVISFGLSGIKAALPPFIADQCGSDSGKITQLKSGERVVIDKELTREHAFNIYYWCVNVGAQSRIPTTFIEQAVGFWASYLMALGSLCVALVVFECGRRKYVEFEQPENVLPSVRQAAMIAVKNGFRLENAKPDIVRERDNKTVSWNDTFINELKTGLVACRSFIPFIIFILCQNQMYTNTISQAASMETHGIPNDLLPNINTVTIIVLMPLFTYLLYPLLRHFGIPLQPLARMAVGFFIEALGIGYTAGVQAWIYKSGPCYEHPRACPASKNGSVPNHVNIAAQIPIYVFQGLSETFAFPASYEYAYTQAPATMKSMVQAVLSLASAAAAIPGLALSPTYKDPDLLVMYACLSGVMFATSVLFVVYFWSPREKKSNQGATD